MTEGLTAEAVLARHTSKPGDERWRSFCFDCHQSVPCDAVVMARLVLAAEERNKRLTAFAEGVAKSENDTAGTRAMARYAITGSLAGALDEMSRAALAASETDGQ